MSKKSVWIVHPGLVFLTLLTLLSPLADLAGQEDARAAKIYQDCSSSVLFLCVKNEKGEKIGQATGFVVSGGRIVTNDHVARAGRVFIDMGVGLVPTTTAGTDRFNDLAVLETAIELAVTPLLFSQKPLTPGESVFAIGNPAGLEKTISTGIVSSIRHLSGRELIQITAPISHGSSGGPVLNARGEVVGVAVGMLDEGQNLNFAVPSDKVLSLLSGRSPSGTSPTALLEEIDSLKADLKDMDFSGDAGSDYQQTWAKIRKGLRTALDSASKDAAVLIKISESAKGYDSEIAIAAAERAEAATPSFDSKWALANALVSAHYGSDDSNIRQLLGRAESLYRECLKLSKGPRPEVIYSLADVLESLGTYAESEKLFSSALDLYRTSSDLDGQAQCFRALSRVYFSQEKLDLGKAAFDSLVKLGKASAWDWSSQAGRLETAGLFHDAGLHYMKSAQSGIEWLWSDWGEAARMFWSQKDDYDAALYCARKCIEEGATRERSEKPLAYCHRLISSILAVRGVHQDALNHARESVALNPEDPWAFDAQAGALIGLRRFLEAAQAATQAIRLSDGRYSSMHFKLGSAHFELANWELALQSFKNAAELAKTDTAAPYNAALCCTKLGYFGDAADWFEEVLRRDPRYPEREQLLKRIGLLRREA